MKEYTIKEFNENNMKIIIGIIGAIVTVVMLIVSMCIMTNNKSVRLEEEISESSQAITILVHKQNKVVGKLVEVVEKYTKHETSIFGKLAEARKYASNGDNKKAIESINVIVENYPQLKSVELYNNLQNEISICENQIMRYRNSYNFYVKTYNQFVKTFPNNIILGIIGHKIVNESYVKFEDEKDTSSTPIFK